MLPSDTSKEYANGVSNQFHDDNKHKKQMLDYDI
jgi:hypothetical protein